MSYSSCCRGSWEATSNTIENLKASKGGNLTAEQIASLSSWTVDLEEFVKRIGEALENPPSPPKRTKR